MCGRYLRRSDKQRIATAFHLSEVPEGLVLPDWDYNVAPTSFQPVIRNDREGRRELVLMRWGLVPRFAKSLADWKGVSTINAAAETLETRPIWRVPFARHRCLVPADGFYEWKQLPDKKKQPFAFSMVEDRPFAFAGLWDAWRDPETQDWLQSFAIITTDPNELAARVHTRMPVILHPRDYERWLDREADQALPLDLLRPYEAEAMTIQPCNPAVGNVRNNGPELLQSQPDAGFEGTTGDSPSSGAGTEAHPGGTP